MRQAILGRLLFRKYSVITNMSTFTVYIRAWFPEDCHNYRAPSIFIVHPLRYAVPKGAVSLPCSSHWTRLGLPGCCASPAMLPSPVATTVVIYSVIMYLALSLSQLPELCFWEGGREGCGITEYCGWKTCAFQLEAEGFELSHCIGGVIPLHRWTAVLWGWTEFARGYQSKWVAFCI